MNNETLDKYFINYSNYFEFNGVKLAFRKRLLFNISSTPKLINRCENNGSDGWWINREWLSISKAKELIINEDATIDVSDLQWYAQCHLDECFNLC
jgi:hypothetical protein